MLALTPSHGFAQTSTEQIWVDVLLDWMFKQKQLLELEIGPKALIGEGEVWQELTVTPAYEYYPNKRWDLVSRVLFSWVRQTVELSTFEVRPIIGFRYYLTPTQTGRWLCRDFNRVEMRMIYYREVDQWETTYRYRNRLEFQYAFNNPSLTNDRTTYGLADAEIFINLGSAAEERFNDNWRFRVGAGYRHTYAWRTEFLYVLQLSRNTLGQEFDVSNHIFRFRIKRFF